MATVSQPRKLSLERFRDWPKVAQSGSRRARISNQACLIPTRMFFLLHCFSPMENIIRPTEKCLGLLELGNFTQNYSTGNKRISFDPRETDRNKEKNHVGTRGGQRSQESHCYSFP